MQVFDIKKFSIIITKKYYKPKIWHKKSNFCPYFVVLKNEVLSQKVVLINVEDGTLVAMGDTLEAAKQEYEQLLANKGIISLF